MWDVFGQLKKGQMRKMLLFDLFGWICRCKLGCLHDKWMLWWVSIYLNMCIYIHTYLCLNIIYTKAHSVLEFLTQCLKGSLADGANAKHPTPAPELRWRRWVLTVGASVLPKPRITRDWLVDIVPIHVGLSKDVEVNPIYTSFHA